MLPFGQPRPLWKACLTLPHMQCHFVDSLWVSTRILYRNRQCFPTVIMTKRKKQLLIDWHKCSDEKFTWSFGMLPSEICAGKYSYVLGTGHMDPQINFDECPVMQQFSYRGNNATGLKTKTIWSITYIRFKHTVSILGSHTNITAITGSSWEGHWLSPPTCAAMCKRVCYSHM
jgi:hypothetical protein